MVLMANLTRWWARITAVLTTAMLAVFVPAAAWAADNELIVEAVRKTRRRGIGGFIGVGSVICCLVVVGAIVLVIVLIMKRRKK
jgi:hypothetical protein